MKKLSKESHNGWAAQEHMIEGVCLSQALRAYIVVCHFGSIKRHFSCENVVYNIILKHCYFNVTFNQER